MIFRVLTGLALMAAGALAEPVRSGPATAEWVSGTTAYAPGKAIHTGIRLMMDEGWHTYWINPGEAGLKIEVKWNLPEGWMASEVSFPVPKRFLTGELPGYGYEHEVIFPVTITAPKGAAGPVELSADASWLVCNNSSCVPGKAPLKLVLGGEVVASPETAEAISKAEALVPKKAAGAKLIVRESDNLLNLSLALPSGSKLDPPGCEVFPESLQAVDHYQPIRFQKTGPTWSASVKKNEYAEGALKELKLVLLKKGETPVELTWKQ